MHLSSSFVCFACVSRILASAKMQDNREGSTLEVGGHMPPPKFGKFFWKYIYCLHYVNMFDFVIR